MTEVQVGVPSEMEGMRHSCEMTGSGKVSTDKLRYDYPSPFFCRNPDGACFLNATREAILFPCDSGSSSAVGWRSDPVREVPGARGNV